MFAIRINSTQIIRPAHIQKKVNLSQGTSESDKITNQTCDFNNQQPRNEGNRSRFKFKQ